MAKQEDIHLLIMKLTIRRLNKAQLNTKGRLMVRWCFQYKKFFACEMLCIMLICFFHHFRSKVFYAIKQWERTQSIKNCDTIDLPWFHRPYTSYLKDRFA